MVIISEEDLIFALEIYNERAIICGKAPECFFGKRRHTCPKDFSAFVYTPWELKEGKAEEPKMVFWKIRELQQYAEDLRHCPLLEIRGEIEGEAPAFFEELRKIFEEITADSVGLKKEAEGRIFLSVFLFGFLALYSANNKEVPYIPQSLVRKLQKSELEKGSKFCKEIGRELKEYNPKWYKMLSRKLKNFELNTYTRRSLFSLLKIFSEGMKKKIKNSLSAKEVFEEVDRILKESKNNNSK